MSMPKQAFLGAVAVLALASGSLLIGPGREFARTLLHAAGIHRPPAPAAIGKALPALAVVDLGGKAMQLTAPARGTVVYNIFASWCGPCQAELPGFRDEAEKLRTRGVRVVGIDQGEAPSRVALFARINRLTYPIFVDEHSESASLLDARVIPETLVVHDGLLRVMLVGPVSPRDLSAAVASV